jgi:hypothetical protein
VRKSLIIVGICLALLVPMFLAAADEFTTMKDIMVDMASYVTYLEDSLDQEIVHLHADIIGTDGQEFNRPLYSDWTYLIAGFADWRVKDLDIVVYKEVDGQWVEIERDEEADNYPTLTISPSSDGMYLISLQVYEFLEDYTAAHYGLMISHDIPE